MATATTKETKPFNHEKMQRRVRSPLQTLRKYIRRYVILEGVALTLLAASLLFWLGIAFDFGLFQIQFDLINIHGLDWIQELNDLDSTGITSFGVRAILLTVIVVALVALGFMKVGLRWMREFNDRALALVLERRFPKQLGDRLITAVELADPKLAKKYGFSEAMVEKTIADAAKTLDTLPVASVFNWRRLFGLWFLVGLSTLGILIVSMILICAGSWISHEVTRDPEAEVDTRPAPLNPYSFSWKFYDVAAIWTERNVLMMNTYWPRSSFLEITKFQPSKSNEHKMRVPRDDKRPDLQIRAIEWVVADRDRSKAPYGWRALRWSDLPLYVDKDLVDAVQIPVDFKHWDIDPEELEPNDAAALFGEDTKTRKSGELRAFFQQAEIAKRIKDRELDTELDKWLDWRTWDVDKIWLQMENRDVRVALRGDNGADHYAKLEAVFDKLKELADSPMMSRTIRRLEVPESVVVTFRGFELRKNRSDDGDPSQPKEEEDLNNSFETGINYQETFTGENNRFNIPTQELKDSLFFRFRARGGNYYTPRKVVELVPSPQPSGISVDKEEPAYIYHRLHNLDQTPLRGLKHRTAKQPMPTGGESNTFELPLGSNLAIHIELDRPLRPEKAVFVPPTGVIEPGYDGYTGKPPAIREDRRGFSLVMSNVTRKHDFTVEFFDEDNIRGKRRFKVVSIIDTEPQLTNLSVGIPLRKPKFKSAPQEKEKEKGKEPEDRRDARDQAELAGAYLITPDAYVPFDCIVKDDYGLVRVGYHYKVRMVDFELVSGSGKKLPSLEVDQVARRRRVGLALSNLQFLPQNPISWHFAPHNAFLSAGMIDQDLRISQGYREAYVGAEGFQDLVERERRRGKMNHLDEVKKNLTSTRGSQPWEFKFQDDFGFDLKKHLKDLKSVDFEKSAQMHYLLQIAVQATDNNVETGTEYDIYVHPDDANFETGPTYLDDKGKPHPAQVKTLRGNTKKNKNGYINFVVISENELLSQIALEEELIFEKLEMTKERIDAAMTSLLQQIDRTGTKDADMDQVLNRMNEIRTALSNSGNTLRESEQAYRNILKEMDYNRVKSDRVSKIDNDIHQPLKRMVDGGSFPKSEEAFHRALGLVEEEVSAKREPDSRQHSTNMYAAHKEMKTLSDELNRVLLAMSDGIVESKLIAILVRIEQERREKDKFWNKRYLEVVEDEINKLLNPDKKNPPKKDETKKEEKKTSSLRLREADVARSWQAAVIDRPLEHPALRVSRWMALRRNALQAMI